MEQSTDFLAALTPKQMKALPLLAAGETAIEVSKKLKISKQSLSEWRQDTNFIQALQYMRKESLNAAVASIEGLAGDAVLTLKTLMVNASSEQLQLRAAIFVIEHLNLKDLHGASEGTNAHHDQNVDMKMLFNAIGISGN